MRRITMLLAVVLAVLALGGAGSGLAEQATPPPSPCVLGQPGQSGTLTFTGHDSDVTQTIMPTSAAYAITLHGDPGSTLSLLTAYDNAGDQVLYASPDAQSTFAGAFAVTGPNTPATAKPFVVAVTGSGGWTITLRPIGAGTPTR